MEEILKAIKERRSIRHYKDTMVPREILDQIVEAGTYAPTARGMQSPIIIVVTNKEVRDRLSRLNAQIMGQEGIDPFYGAPVVCIVLADKQIPTYLYDGSLVMENMMLAAHALGVSSCWIHRAKQEFETQEGKEILASLGITGDYEGIGHCILGYSDDVVEAKPRKDHYVYYID